MSAFQNGSRSFCILSATGAMSTVTLQQAATSGPVTYEVSKFKNLHLIREH